MVWHAVTEPPRFDGASGLRAQSERDQPGYRSGDHHEPGLDDMVMVGGYPVKREDPSGYPQIAGRCDRTRERGKHEVEP